MASNLEVDYCQEELKLLLAKFSAAPPWLFGVLEEAKDLQQELRELELDNLAPDESMLAQLNELINNLWQLRQVIMDCEYHTNEIAETCGWTVHYDEDRNSYWVEAASETDSTRKN